MKRRQLSMVSKFICFLRPCKNKPELKITHPHQQDVDIRR